MPRTTEEYFTLFYTQLNECIKAEKIESKDNLNLFSRKLLVKAEIIDSTIRVTATQVMGMIYFQFYQIRVGDFNKFHRFLTANLAEEKIFQDVSINAAANEAKNANIRLPGIGIGVTIEGVCEQLLPLIYPQVANKTSNDTPEPFSYMPCRLI